MTKRRRGKERKRTDGRRAVSVKGLTFQRIVEHCGKTGQKKSAFLEALIHETLDAQGVPMPTHVRPAPSIDEPDPEGPPPENPFTF